MRERLQASSVVTVSGLCVIVLSLLCVADAGAQDGNAGRDTSSSSASTPNAVREHLDLIDDAVDDLLNWRHVTTSTGGGELFAVPDTTLISVPRAQLDRVSTLLTATLSLVPAAATPAPAPRGDLRAHLDKAQEITREMLTAASPISTTGKALITIDRTALQRLEIEIDAAERLARRETP